MLAASGLFPPLPLGGNPLSLCFAEYVLINGILLSRIPDSCTKSLIAISSRIVSPFIASYFNVSFRMPSVIPCLAISSSSFREKISPNISNLSGVFRLRSSKMESNMASNRLYMILGYAALIIAESCATPTFGSLVLGINAASPDF